MADTISRFSGLEAMASREGKDYTAIGDGLRDGATLTVIFILVLLCLWLSGDF